MKVKQFLAMSNDVAIKLKHFDIQILLKKRKTGEVDKKRIDKLINDMYELEEDLVIINCERY